MTDEQKWVPLTLKSSRCARILKIAPAMIFEVARESSYNFKANGSITDFDRSRVPDMATIYVMLQAPLQCYRAKQLDYCVHYQMAQDGTEAIHRECRRLRGQDLYAPEVIVLPPDKDFEDDFLLVRNNPSPQLLQSLDFRMIMNYVLENASADKKGQKNVRNTPKIDLGTTGHNNSRRDGSDFGLGLARPYRHAHTNSPQGRSILRGSSDAFKRVFHDQTHLYFCDEERNGVFSNSHVDQSITEALAALVADVMVAGKVVCYHYLKAHTDAQNDKRDPRYRGVVGFSQLLDNEEEDSARRTSVVMYGKLSGGDFMDRLRLYGPLLREMYDTWENLPIWQKIADHTLIPGPDEPMGRTLQAPHSQKTVLYSVFADTIDLVLSRFQELAQHHFFVAGLLFCTTVSNCPQHFWFEIRKVAEQGSIKGQVIKGKQPMDVVVDLYNHLFDVKSGGHKKAADYIPTPRHQPCHNTRATRVQILNSVSVIARVVRDLRRTPTREFEDDPAFFYHAASMVLTRPCINDRIVDLLQETNDCGVYSAGPLIAQHILGTAACLQVIPAGLALHAHIGPTTKTWKYYSKKYKLNEGKQVDHSDTILLAASSYLGIFPVQAEELACLNAKKATLSKFKTHDFIGCDGCLYIPQPGKKKGEIQRINRIGQSISQAQWTKCVDWNLSNTRLPPRLPPLWSGKCLSYERKNMPVKKTKQRKFQKLRLEDSFPFLTGEGLPIPNPHTVVLACKPHHAKMHAREADFNLDLLLRKCIGAYGRYQFVMDADGVSPRDFMVEQRHGSADISQPRCTVEWGGRRPPKRKRQHGNPSFFSHAVRIPTEEGVSELYVPPPDFPLRPDYPKEDSSETVVKDERRWFRSGLNSREFTGLAIAAELGYEDPTGLFTYFFDKVVELHGGPTARMKVISRCLMNGETKKPPGTEQRRYQVKPFLVALEYTEGGRAYYLTDPSGKRISGVFLIPRPPQQYMAVYDHEDRKVEGTVRTWIAVRVREGTKWMPLSDVNKDDIHWPLYQYARRNKLLEKPGWKRFAKVGKCLPAMVATMTCESVRQGF